MDIYIRGDIHIGAGKKGGQTRQIGGLIGDAVDSERPACSLRRAAVSTRREGMTASCSRNWTGAVLKLMPATNIMGTSLKGRLPG
jgi:hypothetical protein